eukprot:jgi/Chlat1/4175/Chrsp27S04234
MAMAMAAPVCVLHGARTLLLSEDRSPTLPLAHRKNARRRTQRLQTQAASSPVQLPAFRGRTDPSTPSTSSSSSSLSSSLPLPSALPPPLPSSAPSLPIITDDFQWARESYSERRRSADIWVFVLSLRARLYTLDAKWTYPGGFTEEKQAARRRSVASWARDGCLRLGPTFIKIGQLFSTRSDVLPVEFVQELSLLQDRVPAFSVDKALSIIKQEFGAPADRLFASFDPRPIAAASLGQVHRAVLKTGEEVVVKVQRPGLKKLFDIDLGNLKTIATVLGNTEEGSNRDWLGIYDEVASILYKEIDYVQEGQNADRFRREFRGNSSEQEIRVPIVYWRYTSPRVITLQYLPGVKISDVGTLSAAGIDVKSLARIASEAYLQQACDILRSGFFHADCHPGNLAVDLESKALVYYDFGMMGEIPNDTRSRYLVLATVCYQVGAKRRLNTHTYTGRLLRVFYAVYEKNAGKVIDALVELGALVPTGDMTPVRRSIQFFLDNLTEQREQNETLAAIGEDLFAIAVDQPFRFPATFTFVIRSFTTLEGIGKMLDPDYSFAKVAKPYIQELLDLRSLNGSSSQFVLQEFQRQAEEVSTAAVSVPMRVQRMDATLSALADGDFRPRVRVLESERASRRSGILQMATLNTVAAGSLLNAGVTLAVNQATPPATLCLLLSGVFAVQVWIGMVRVKRLDQFEKKIKDR